MSVDEKYPPKVQAGHWTPTITLDRLKRTSVAEQMERQETNVASGLAMLRMEGQRVPSERDKSVLQKVQQNANKLGRAIANCEHSLPTLKRKLSRVESTESRRFRTTRCSQGMRQRLRSIFSWRTITRTCKTSIFPTILFNFWSKPQSSTTEFPRTISIESLQVPCFIG